MRALRLALALGVFWIGLVSHALADNTVGPTNQVICNQVAQSNPVTATTALLVAGITGKSIFSCGWHVTSTQATSTTFQFVYGTGATCGTGQQPITPPFNITSTAPSADHISIASYQIPPGNNICIITVGTTIGDAVAFYFSQF
jgi:hypothetical protein